MSESLPATTATRPISPLLVVVGILFILTWGAVSTVLITMSLMGTLMANDSGSAASESHSSLILGVLVSQIVIGAAGLPAGLAFFWRRKRRPLLVTFAILLFLGILGLVGAVMAFMPGAATA